MKMPGFRCPVTKNQIGGTPYGQSVGHRLQSASLPLTQWPWKDKYGFFRQNKESPCPYRFFTKKNWKETISRSAPTKKHSSSRHRAYASSAVSPSRISEHCRGCRNLHVFGLCSGQYGMENQSDRDPGRQIRLSFRTTRETRYARIDK